MNIRDLEYLVAITDEGNMARAAKRLHVSAPTLSIQIKKLEESLGSVLFERQKRSIMLTDVGTEVVSRARIILNQVQEIRELAGSAHDPLSGTLKLGTFPTLAPYWFPNVVPQIQRALPTLALELVEEKTDTLLDMLRAGSLDCAVLALPIDAPDLNTAALFWEPFYLAVPSRHALADRETVSLKDVRSETLLLLEEGHCLRGQALEFCTKIGLKASGSYRATSLETLRNMVAAGAGLTLMPQSAIKAGDYSIRTIPFDAPAPGRTLGLVTRASSPRKALFRKLERLLKAE